MSSRLLISAQSLVDRLFLGNENLDRRFRKFMVEMIEGILMSRSTLLSNIARVVRGESRFSSTHQRLAKMICNERIPWGEFKLRALEVSSQMVESDAIIAFDPGDITKKYARTMEDLYRVHDGSEDGYGLGYEEFGVEAVQWRNGVRENIPLYTQLSNASRPDYLSQNERISEAIETVHSHIGAKGVWTFDRGHDRIRLIEKVFLSREAFRFVLRLKENRNVIPVDEKYQDLRRGNYYARMIEVADHIPLKKHFQLTFPKKSGLLHVGFTKVRLPSDPNNTELTLIVVHDKRNKEPVRLLTNLKVTNETEAALCFGYYLERWGKEEGYRFTKSFLNLEDIRVQKFAAIENLAFLVHLTYLFIAILLRSGAKLIKPIAAKRLQNFKPISRLKNQIERSAHAIRLLLIEQKKLPLEALMLTEVG